MHVHSFRTIVFIINKLPSKFLNSQSPYQLLHDKIPNYGFLRVFGSSCCPYTRSYNRHKLEPCSMHYVCLGYTP